MLGGHLKLNVDNNRLAAALEGHANRLAGLLTVESFQQIQRRTNCAASDFDEYVTQMDVAVIVFIRGEDSDLLRTTVLEDISNECPLFNAQSPGDGVLEQTHTEYGSFESPMLDQLGHNHVDDIDRNGKAHAGVNARRADDHRVHTNQPAGTVEQRTT